MRGLKGFDEILKLLSGMLRERQHRLLYLANSARVGPRQFADLDVLLDGLGGIIDGVGRAATNAAGSVSRKIGEWRRNSKTDGE